MIKKSAFVFLLIIAFCIGCVSRQTIKSPDSAATKKNRVVFSGGAGDSYETAVIINGTSKSRDAVMAEYDYISQLFGEKDNAWKVEEQSMIKEGNKTFDMIRVRIIVNDKMHFLYFDISSVVSRKKNAAKDN
jgi:hypothetical protein